MLLSAVSVLVVAQSSSEIPEGLMNNPVLSGLYYVVFPFGLSIDIYHVSGGKRWCSWLRHCATSRKVAGPIPDGVTRIFN